jgi:predicted nucleic-acid-binding Zn-ribbon protein
MADAETRQSLRCPLCHGTDFQQEEGGLDSKWGFSQHRMWIMICEKCRFVMLFSKGRSFWMNFD